MPRASKAESEQTARRILAVATEHFRERGYEGTDLVTVAIEAGVTRGAVYHHYPNKKAIFTAVAANLHAKVQDRVESAAAQHADSWDQLIAGSEACIDAAVDPAISKILVTDAPSVLGWDVWRQLDESTSFTSLTDVMGELESAGQLRPGSSEASARLLSGAMNEAVLWLAYASEPDRAKAQVLQSLTAMIRSLKR